VASLLILLSCDCQTGRKKFKGGQKILLISKRCLLEIEGGWFGKQPFQLVALNRVSQSALCYLKVNSCIFFHFSFHKMKNEKMVALFKKRNTEPDDYLGREHPGATTRQLHTQANMFSRHLMIVVAVAILGSTQVRNLPLHLSRLSTPPLECRHLKPARRPPHVLQHQHKPLVLCLSSHSSLKHGL
jgi:hypothetical protein